ncbi:glucose-1-phosphate thymidylyltransferase [Turneriella parva]|uniref:Glucose-1-phosphate thymidylyltransferase n=1 Tax=Turneriella parva (strain ATCC BAA-1111 / DSM 21527 / NCTC 11395 / H) TaxID=869212 RepID=I4B5X8_TURPD|nr:glucose-1-phosphate thymidylyltransferase [Turneriella parva]AFM12685.1 glucose-1-phosphate thymidylyltransferase [Turneriella parva DSM 21527]
MNAALDIFEPTLLPLLRLKPLFLLRDGIYSPWQRARRTGKACSEAITGRSNPETAALSQLDASLANLRWISSDTKHTAARPAALLTNIGKQIEADLSLLDAYFSAAQPNTLQIEGNAARAIIHPEAAISRHAVIDTRGGPVVVDAGARIGAFCLIQGPAYIGKKTQLDSCRFSNSIAGENCRLGGEIADSIIGDFSNKHHDGFLGHSLVGDWVNLGALTTTSDLKNNYGEVRLTFNGTRYETGTIKFGAIIGDYAKTAIGTLIGTGTIIDLGANLFGKAHWSGYVPLFTWGEGQKYEGQLFLRDANRMMQRRGRSVTPPLEALLNSLVPRG